MNYEKIDTIDILDVYVRTPGCWRLGISSDLSCNVMQGFELKLSNGTADGAKAEVWIYAFGDSRSDAYIQTSHTFDYSSDCLLDYSAIVSRMLGDGITDAVMDIDYTSSANVTTTGRFPIKLRDGMWGTVSPVSLPSRLVVVGGAVCRLSIANRTTSAKSYVYSRGGAVVDSTNVNPQEAYNPTVTAAGGDTIEFGGVQVPVVDAECGAVMLTWKSKEDGTYKSYAFGVMAESLNRDSTMEVSVEGLKEWWQTGGGRKRLLLASCDWRTWRYIRDLDIADDIMMTVSGYDAMGSQTTLVVRVRMASAVGGIPVNGTADVEFEIETWKEVTVWAR